MDKKDEKRKSITFYKGKGRTIEKVKWPNTEKEVGILKMNCAELQQGRFAALEYFDKKGVDLTIFSSNVLDQEEMTQQCYLFLIDPDANSADYKIFKSADEVRSTLTNDERYYFCHTYNQLYEKENDE